VRESNQRENEVKEISLGESNSELFVDSQNQSAFLMVRVSHELFRIHFEFRCDILHFI
jgi:hypothetical protein